MGAVSYPDARVVAFITDHLVPLRVPWDEEPVSRTFNVRWTPTLVTVDDQATEHHRTVGFLAPEELIPSLLLGIGKTHFNRDRFDVALGNLERVMTEYPQSDSAPEAVYFHGVSCFKREGDPRFLKEAYRRLTATYPASVWARRAAPFRLL